MQTIHHSLINEKDIVKFLAKRTGLDENEIHTILYHFERAVLHHVMMGHHVRINQFFTIYNLGKHVEIELTYKAIKLKKENRTYVLFSL
jgi:hypothetical protein